MGTQHPHGFAKFRELIDEVEGVRTALKQFIRSKIREEGLDITVEMLEVLLVLWKGDQRNQQDIADAVRKNKASVTSLIDNLSARNLVVREQDPVDRRNNIISLTPEGRRYKEKAEALVHESYKIFQKELSLEQLERTTRILRRLQQRILQES